MFILTNFLYYFVVFPTTESEESIYDCIIANFATVLLWLTKEFFYQTLLLTATGVTEPVGLYVLGDKNISYQCNLLT